jgi:hypothetical protein
MLGQLESTVSHQAMDDLLVNAESVVVGRVASSLPRGSVLVFEILQTETFNLMGYDDLVVLSTGRCIVDVASNLFSRDRSHVVFMWLVV